MVQAFAISVWLIHISLVFSSSISLYREYAGEERECRAVGENYQEWFLWGKLEFLSSLLCEIQDVLLQNATRSSAHRALTRLELPNPRRIRRFYCFFQELVFHLQTFSEEGLGLIRVGFFLGAERWDAYIDYWMREYCCVTLLWIMLRTKTMQMVWFVCLGDIISWRMSTACGAASSAPDPRRTKTFPRKVGTAEKQSSS